MGSKQRAVIFDFDGTLADSVVAFARVFEELTAQPEPLTPKLIAQLRGMTPMEFIDYFQLPKWKVPYLVYRGRRLLKTRVGDIKLYPGVAAMLKELHERGIPMYILSSNSADTIEMYLAQHSIARYFSGVVGNASPFGKARKFLRLIDEHNIDATRSWYIGDETRDVIAAHAVGIHMAAVGWGFNTAEALALKKPDIVIHDTAELAKLIRDEWKK